MNNDRVELYVSEQHPQINDGIKYIHLTHIQSIDNASCMEIEVGNCLDYALERNEILQVIISKLRYNGTLQINGIDLTEIMYNVVSGNLNLPQVQQLLYAGKLSAGTYENTKQQLQQANLTIINETLVDNQYFFTAKRELNE